MKITELYEGKAYRIDRHDTIEGWQAETIIKNPLAAQMRNLASRSQMNAVRILIDSNLNLWVCSADNLIHFSMYEHIIEKIEHITMLENYNFTLLREDGFWNAWADEDGTYQDFLQLEKMPNVIRATEGRLKYDEGASNRYYGI